MILVATTAATAAHAGGGPENVLLLVNTNSLDSKTIANYYIALRRIPASNVVYIDWQGALETCQGEAFSEKILRPAMQAINDRGLGAQIDYVVYSCDFPWRVNLKTLFPEAKFDLTTRPWASTTSATYLWHYVRDKNPAMMLPVVNWYVSPSGGNNLAVCQKLKNVKSHGFCATTFWTAEGETTKDRSKGQSYLLSTMLGVTSGCGNTIPEVLSYLKRSARVDGTQPQGTFYYMKNNSIRSRPRQDCYDAAGTDLRRFGVGAVVLPGVLPKGAKDVLGIMTGTPKFDFPASGSTLLPGAICDNLTSFGGVLQTGVSQTPLVEFLRAASGCLWHHRRTNRHASQISAAVAVHSLRTRLLACRIVLPVGGGPIHVACGGRSALPAVCRFSQGDARRHQAGTEGAGHAPH